jgi:hypothetical protein
METKKEDRLLMKIVTILANYKFNSTQTETGEMIAERIINIVKEQDREIKLSKISKLSNCIICNKNIAEMCGECMLKSQLEVGNKRYKKAIDDFVIRCKGYAYFNELLVVDWFRITEIAKELGAKDETKL